MSIAILAGLFFTVMISEDSAVVSGALLAWKGVLPHWQAFLACFLGMWSSDLAIYLIVKLGGTRVMQSRWMRRLVSNSKMEMASRWFARYGGFALVFSRLVLGTRTALLVVAGLMRYPTRRFLAVTAAGAAGWLLIVFTLFSILGPPFVAVFGLRWVIALIALLSGGGATVFVMSRARKNAVKAVNGVNGEKVDLSGEAHVRN
jgi:membrane protein DedA with SNARE-associated domain